jgi:hypothetical protein
MSPPDYPLTPQRLDAANPIAARPLKNYIQS